jgi:hypothetical protein
MMLYRGADALRLFVLLQACFQSPPASTPRKRQPCRYWQIVGYEQKVRKLLTYPSSFNVWRLYSDARALFGVLEPES